MNRKMSKRQRDIKSKLMAAICMLLVSSIMMVSTTYAWFTLSTAPEVTGINTAVGANGNLEMALLPLNGSTADIKSEAGDSTKNILERNLTWGNLVDLSSTSYGLDQIAMYPAALNVENEDTLGTALLKFPSYGADGRVAELMADTFTGVYDSGSFSPDNSFGVRAVGSASGMTDRQLSYRNARGTADSAKSYAAKLASESLDRNGDALAGIAIKKGTSDAPQFTDADIAALNAIVTDLIKDGGILDQIETAYMQYILAYAASRDTGTADLAWQYVKGLVEADGATLASVVAGLTDSDELPEGVSAIDLPAQLKNGITAYNATRAAVDNVDDDLTTDGDTRGAKQLLEALQKEAGNDYYTWAQIRPVLLKLANPEEMVINGTPVRDLNDDTLGDLVTSVATQGINVVMKTGGGVYADIADQTQNFTADVTIEKIEYLGKTMGPFPAKMKTEGKNPSYLSLIGTAVETAGAPDGGAAGSVPITDMYGYVIDMAFRTNAASSNLVLQTQAADRIYTSNNASGGAEVNGETTMGNGANMTFYSVNPSFSNDSVVNLMKAIRVVFFDPDSKEIVKYALLDLGDAQTPKYTTTADGGVKADLKLYTYNATESTAYYTATETDTENGGITYTVYYADADLTEPFCRSYTETTEGTDGAETTTKTMWQTYTAGADGEEGTWNAATETEPAGIPSYKTEAGFAPASTNTIMPLTQNVPQKLSALVYLDGEKITNKDVASNGAKSVTGTLNLQFSSDANLTPMNYTPLMAQTGSGAEEGTALKTVTVNSATQGITASGSFDAEGKATITVTGLADSETIIEVSVDDTKVDGAAISGNTVTFTQTGLTADSVIVVKTSTGS